MLSARYVLSSLVAALCLLAASAPARAECPPGQVEALRGCARSADVAARVDTVVRAAMEEHGLKAVLAGVAVDGERQVLGAWGESMTGVPARPDMHFRNGAVAIAYLGTVLSQLDDAGVLSVDDRLSKWFPHYPRAAEIDLKMLIRGTSGYADYVTAPKFLRALAADPFRAWTPDEMIDIGLGRRMVCRPGTCWSYAHTNFVILGKVLEKASGRRLDQLIRRRIVDRLALENSRSEPTARIQAPALHAFTAERGIYEDSTYWDPSWTLAHGAIMTSNIADLLTSAEAIGEGALVSRAARRRQFDPANAVFPPWNPRIYYGWGVFMVNGWVLQNPSFNGFAATMAYLPRRKLAVAVSVTTLDGAEGNRSSGLADDIAAIFAPGFPMK